MLILLQALIELFLAILRGMAIPFALAVWGAVAITALLQLATFQWKPRGILKLLSYWFGMNLFPIPIGGGIGCAFFYSVLLYMAPALKGGLSLFLVSLVTGLNLRFLRSMAPTSKTFRWRTFYIVWVYFWLTASIGVRYGIGGLLLITLPALLITGLALFFIAGFLLPYPELDVKGAPAPASLISTFGQEIKTFFVLMRRPQNKDARKKWFEQRRVALRCLLTYAFGTNYPYHVVIDEKITERTEDDRTWLPWKDKLIKRLDGDAFGDFLAGPGIILTGCDQAVVLSTGLKFKGAKGPGVVFTGMSDSITQVIDLRVQLRAFPVTARTKDGIAVKVFTFTPFRMGRGKDEPERGKGFPYRTSDVFKAIQAQMVEHKDPSQVPEELEQHEWYDLPKVIGERAVREAISQYNFDDLYAPFELHADFGQHPRAKIGKALQEALERELPEMGLQRVGSGISNLEPEDPRVIEQRIEAWEADWKRKIMLQQADGQSKRLRLVEQARAQAQIDIIVDIGKRIEALRDAGAPVPMDAVARQFIDVLEKLAERASPHRMLPPGETKLVAQRARERLEQSVQGQSTQGE